jgi:ComF family protein
VDVAEHYSDDNSLVMNSKALGSPGLFAPKRLLQGWFSLAIDLLFPPRCGGCGKVDTFWCETCQEDIDHIAFPAQVRQLPAFSGLASSALHTGKIREAVQALKYENVPSVAEPLGQRLAKHLAAQRWMIDTLIPVPLSTTRLKERGYNQAELLAQAVSKHSAIPCASTALRRQKHTESQVTMTAAERLTNVQQAFSADSIFVKDRSVLIIDDVLTTGATLTACGEALLSVGAAAVYGLTVTAARI